jgi:hypothetical protein
VVFDVDKTLDTATENVAATVQGMGYAVGVATAGSSPTDERCPQSIDGCGDGVEGTVNKCGICTIKYRDSYDWAEYFCGVCPKTSTGTPITYNNVGERPTLIGVPTVEAQSIHCPNVSGYPDSPAYPRNGNGNLLTYGGRKAYAMELMAATHVASGVDPKSIILIDDDIEYIKEAYAFNSTYCYIHLEGSLSNAWITKHIGNNQACYSPID